MGSITEDSLTDLGLIVNLVKYLGNSSSAKSSDDKSPKSVVYGSSECPGPDFFWCLRDFNLDLSGKYESAQGYMEEALKPVLGVSSDILKKNQIRKSVAAFFRKRECFTMIRPLTDEELLAEIEF
jgi:hypothetical protein